jgi:DNA-binding LacI/PurR family transcriptional regulator
VHRGVRRGRRSGLIDLIFNGLDSPWAVEILRGVEDWCAGHATGAAVSAVRHGSALPASWTSAPASHDTEGVILVTSELTAPQLEQLRGEGIPIVVVDPVNLPDADLPSVGTTNWAGGLAATDHLVSLGHRSARSLSGTAISSTKAGSCAAASCSTCPSRRPRSSPAATSRRSASTRRPASTGCGSRRICLSSASTTCPWPGGYPRR